MRPVVVLLLLSLAPQARAQSRPEALAPLRVDEASLDKAYRRARARRNIGIALAIPGVASTLLGIMLIAYAANEEPYFNAEGAELGSGVIIAIAGLAVGIPGVVLWTQGQDDMDVVKWRRQQLSPLISLKRDGAVAGLSLTF